MVNGTGGFTSPNRPIVESVPQMLLVRITDQTWRDRQTADGAYYSGVAMMILRKQEQTEHVFAAYFPHGETP